MSPSTQIVNRLLPVLFLLALGYWLRRRNVLAATTMDDLRNIVVNLALPAVLFSSFLQIQFKSAYLVVFVLLYALCVGLFGLGRWLARRLRVEHPYFPFLMTGFEYGMLGISLFGSAYGLEKIGYLAIVDLGHEIFIWSFFLVLLLLQRDGRQDPRRLLGSFLTSPVVIAIAAGIALNLLGARAMLYDLPVTGAIMATLAFLGNLVIPLILMIVGYGMKLDRSGLREAARVVLIRLAILVPLALALNTIVLRGLLGLEREFELALFTLLVLPPPFIVPLYARADMVAEKRYVNTVLTLYTVVSIGIFIAFFVASAWT